MAKKKTQFMDLNRETAMRLWCKSFGKATKATDFTGREIAKGAYNDRNSEYGWNVDHILPQGKGGKTADHNLICCHISTNDEKADKFPCFVANGIKFEIVKVENHYEIKRVINTEKQQKTVDTSAVNFFDSAAGIRFFKKLKGKQNKARFVGSVLIRLQNVSNTAIIDFIEKFFDEENISYSMSKNYGDTETKIIAINYDMAKDDFSALLDKCILLNTYLKFYFLSLNYVTEYDICYQVNRFEKKQDMYLDAQTINFDGIDRHLGNALFINELVYLNTEAEQYESDLEFKYFGYNKYDYTYTKLTRNLKKEVSGK
ncbi:MAG: HNH endonuclease signature motif containing protein [Candidatus Borkfalkiaceae bacterium]|nr:HNH endonuclease signature motif containing protein [Christensenellaceae bacterium]